LRCLETRGSSSVTDRSVAASSRRSTLSSSIWGGTAFADT
jgi:hypothetical protein